MFEVSLKYAVSLRPAWAVGEVVSNGEKQAGNAAHWWSSKSV